MRRDLIRRFLEADVKCYLCGQPAGTLRREEGVGEAPAVFKDCLGGPATVVSSLAAVRCRHCQGSLYADEVDVVYEYVLDALAAERPPRGRPRKLRSA